MYNHTLETNLSLISGIINMEWMRVMSKNLLRLNTYILYITN